MAQSVERDLQAGDVVWIKTLAGEEYRFKVQSIGGGKIVGGGHEIALADVQEISVQWFDGTKTAKAFTVPLVILASVAVVVGAVRWLLVDILKLPL